MPATDAPEGCKHPWMIFPAYQWVIVEAHCCQNTVMVQQCLPDHRLLPETAILLAGPCRIGTLQPSRPVLLIPHHCMQSQLMPDS